MKHHTMICMRFLKYVNLYVGGLNFGTLLLLQFVLLRLPHKTSPFNYEFCSSMGSKIKKNYRSIDLFL